MQSYRQLALGLVVALSSHAMLLLLPAAGPHSQSSPLTELQLKVRRSAATSTFQSVAREATTESAAAVAPPPEQKAPLVPNQVQLAANPEIGPPVPQPPQLTEIIEEPGNRKSVEMQTSGRSSLPDWLRDLAKLPEIDTHYYESRELDTTSRPIDAMQPEEPADYADNPQNGLVKLRVLINEKGEVDDIIILDSSLPDAYTKAALDAFRKGRFTPAIRGTEYVRSRKDIEVCFGFCPD
ncbi:TonB family protein [Parachitinimonas caeni]|uniref:TonB family protein n=1 Tax=Parachitinimonas caeni TaxID=3031301 RepID=A0ABT7DUL6_9NEIS|nr:TonB family protein [Parachitinimonas caeni]MDK2123519.1 TonB family protein [Parachitinimonas caeni]